VNDLFYVDTTNIPKVKDDAGNVTVPCDGDMLCLRDLSRKKLLDAREHLESIYGDVEARKEEFLGGEDELRRALRALRYQLGPNLDRSKAIVWPVLGLVVGEVDLERDPQDSRKSFRAIVNSVDKWMERAKAETKLFSDNIWKVTWGKINLQFEVIKAPCPMKKLNTGGQIGKHSFEPLLRNVRKREVMTVFVFAPKEGDDELPCDHPVALCKPLDNGAYVIWLPASEKRMQTSGRFAGLDCFRGGRGMPHEFWHTIRHLLKGELNLTGNIFLPDINSKGARGQKNRRDFRKVKDEVAELGIPLSPQERLEEYYAMWPTWRQCQQLANLYSPGLSKRRG